MDEEVLEEPFNENISEIWGSNSPRSKLWAQHLGLLHEGNNFGADASDSYLEWIAEQLAQMNPQTDIDGADYNTLCQDLNRTRASDPFFQQAQIQDWMARALGLVLRERQLVYMQGLHDILVPFLMLDSVGDNPEPYVYALFSAFIAQFLPCIFLSDDSQILTLRSQLNLVSQLIQYHDPAFAQFLDRLQMHPEVYATNWAVTAFASKLPVAVTILVWDHLIEAGNPMLLHFFLSAFLIHHREEVLEASDSEVPETLTQLAITTQEEVETVWHLAIILHARSPLSYLKTTSQLCYDPSFDLNERAATLEALENVPCLEVYAADVLEGLMSPQGDSDLDDGDPYKYILLDSREDSIVAQGFVKGAVRVDPCLLEETLSVIQGNIFNQLVLFLQPLCSEYHCIMMGSWNGNRPDEATSKLSKYLINLSFEHVAILHGGFVELARHLHKEGFSPQMNGIMYDLSEFAPEGIPPSLSMDEEMLSNMLEVSAHNLQESKKAVSSSATKNSRQQFKHSLFSANIGREVESEPNQDLSLQSQPGPPIQSRNFPSQPTSGSALPDTTDKANSKFMKEQGLRKPPAVERNDESAFDSSLRHKFQEEETMVPLSTLLVGSAANQESVRDGTFELGVYSGNKNTNSRVLETEKSNDKVHRLQHPPPLSLKVDISMEQALEKGPDAVLQLWERNLSEEAVCHTALSFFLNQPTSVWLGITNGKNSKTETSEIAQIVLLSICAHQNSKDVYLTACQMLIILQLGKEQQQQPPQTPVLNQKAAEAMVDGLKHFDKDTSVAIQGMRTLAMLAMSEHNRRTIAEADAIVTVVQTMQGHGASDEVLEAGTKLLHVLCFSEDNKLAMLEAGGVSAVLWAMRLFASNIVIAANGCGVLFFLAFDLESQIAQDSGISYEAVLDAVVSAMQRFPKHVDIQTTGLGVLHSFAFQNTLLRSIAGRGGLQLFSRCIQCIQEEEPLSDLIELLHMVLQDSPCREVLVVREGSETQPGKAVLDLKQSLEDVLHDMENTKSNKANQELAKKTHQVIAEIHGILEDLRAKKLTSPVQEKSQGVRHSEEEVEMVPLHALQELAEFNAELLREVNHLKQALQEAKLQKEAEARTSKEAQYRLAVAEVSLRQQNVQQVLMQSGDRRGVEYQARIKFLEEAIHVAQDEAQNAISKLEEAVDLNRQVHQQLALKEGELMSAQRQCVEMEDEAQVLKTELEAARALLLRYQERVQHREKGKADSYSQMRELSEALTSAVTDLKRCEEARAKERGEFQLVVRHLQDQQCKAEDERSAAFEELGSMQRSHGRILREAHEREMMAAEEIVVLKALYQKPRKLHWLQHSPVQALQSKILSGNFLSGITGLELQTKNQQGAISTFSTSDELLQQTAVAALQKAFSRLANAYSTTKTKYQAVPVIRVRRYIQQLQGLLDSTSRLTHADIDLALKMGVSGAGTVMNGGGSVTMINFELFSEAINSLFRKRYPRKPLDFCLQKLIQALCADDDEPPFSEWPDQSYQGQMISSSFDDHIPSHTMKRASSQGNMKTQLKGVEKVISRNRKALGLIFSNYASTLSGGNTMYSFSTGLESKALNLDALFLFTRDFSLSPGLIQKKTVNETFQRIIEEGQAGAGRYFAEQGEEDSEKGRLTFEGFLAWLSLASSQCEWFQEQKGYDKPVAKILGILQWMDSSAGKEKIWKSRNQRVIPPFDVSPVCEDDC